MQLPAQLYTQAWQLCGQHAVPSVLSLSVTRSYVNPTPLTLCLTLSVTYSSDFHKEHSKEYEGQIVCGSLGDSVFSEEPTKLAVLGGTGEQAVCAARHPSYATCCCVLPYKSASS